MSSDIRELLFREIMENVPLIFNGDTMTGKEQENYRSQFSDRLQLLFSRDTPIDTFYQDLKNSGPSSSICGKVFSHGDQGYSCLECRIDQNRVLCTDCFLSSSHTEHLYCMFAISGGGCCDCGDVESWKKDPFCEEHR